MQLLAARTAEQIPQKTLMDGCGPGSRLRVSVAIRHAHWRLALREPPVDTF
jgi:hypothetical protein